MLLQYDSGKKSLKLAIFFLLVLILILNSACVSIPADTGNTDTSLQSTTEQSMDTDNERVSLSASIISGLNYVVVDTGQHKCYGNTTEITCPAEGEPFYGQDAQFAGAQPAYQDNGNGTITDLNTGLMWQKTPGNKVTYQDAVRRAADFTLAGYNDWRLPTIKELYSLIDFSGTDPSGLNNIKSVPFIDTDYFDYEYGDIYAGDRVIDAQYWSSTEYLGTTMGGNATVFGVNFADGRIKGYPRDKGPRGEAMTEFVRYVRGNEDYGINDFADNGDGTVTDEATGLMWSQADSGQAMNWEDALLWVQQKNSESYLGYNDWRLPDAKELQSIVDYSRSPSATDSAAIDPIFEVTVINNERGIYDYPYYWTNTTHVKANKLGDAAVYVSFGEALGFWMNEWVDVHGAGAQRSDPKSSNLDSYPLGHGPQGDAIHIYNFVRPVRDADL
jgi:hypothetical protein